MTRPKPTTKNIKFRSKDVINQATELGCEIMLLCMGDTLKFNKHGIKYTITRKWED